MRKTVIIFAFKLILLASFGADAAQKHDDNIKNQLLEETKNYYNKPSLSLWKSYQQNAGLGEKCAFWAMILPPSIPTKAIAACAGFAQGSCLAWGLGSIPACIVAIGAGIVFGCSFEKTIAKSQEEVTRRAELLQIEEIILASLAAKEIQSMEKKDFPSTQGLPLVTLLKEYQKIDSAHNISVANLASMIRAGLYAGYFVSLSSLELAGLELNFVGKWEGKNPSELMTMLASAFQDKEAFRKQCKEDRAKLFEAITKCHATKHEILNMDSISDGDTSS